MHKKVRLTTSKPTSVCFVKKQQSDFSLRCICAAGCGNFKERDCGEGKTFSM